MFDSQTLAFTGIALLFTLLPGADTMLVVRGVLARGALTGLLTTLGICTGLFIHATLSALGLSLILLRSATAFEAMKLAGALYLAFLGIQSLWNALRKRPGALAQLPAAAVAPDTTLQWRALLDGLLCNVLNPKVAIFYLAFLPQFIAPGDPALVKSLLLAGIHFVLGVAWLSLVSLALGRLRPLFTRPRIQRGLEATTGAILVGFGARLALER